MEEMVTWSTSKARRKCGRAGNLRWRRRARNDRLRPMQAGRSNFHYHFSLLFRSEKMVTKFDKFVESFVFYKASICKKSLSSLLPTHSSTCSIFRQTSVHFSIKVETELGDQVVGSREGVPELKVSADGGSVSGDKTRR
ncbi:hypothetical protein ACFXTH_019283 [Malus domestica]